MIFNDPGCGLNHLTPAESVNSLIEEIDALLVAEKRTKAREDHLKKQGFSDDDINEETMPDITHEFGCEQVVLARLKTLHASGLLEKVAKLL